MAQAETSSSQPSRVPSTDLRRAQLVELAGLHAMKRAATSPSATKADQRAYKAAVQRFLEKNDNLAVSFAMKYRRRGVAFEDTLQAARLGMAEAVADWDPARGQVAFSSFVAVRCRAQIVEGLYQTQAPLVRVSSVVHKDVRIIRKAQRDTPGAKTVEELVELTGLPKHRIAAALAADARGLEWESLEGADPADPRAEEDAAIERIDAQRRRSSSTVEPAMRDIARQLLQRAEPQSARMRVLQALRAAGDDQDAKRRGRELLGELRTAGEAR
jgi:RNA polymerase sigma factor (sigma-70 family)